MRLLGRLSDFVRHRALERSATPERALACRGEDYAHRFLQRRGYKIVARNYRTASGRNEVDLIARHNGRLVFVEVKTRNASEVSAPERAVTLEKQRRIIAAALDYTRRSKAELADARFDVVSVTVSRQTTVEVFEDAFGASPKLY